MKKTIIAVLLALSMLALLAGCSGSKDLSSVSPASSSVDCCQENSQTAAGESKTKDCCSMDEDLSNESSESENAANTNVPDCCG